MTFNICVLRYTQWRYPFLVVSIWTLNNSWISVSECNFSVSGDQTHAHMLCMGNENAFPSTYCWMGVHMEKLFTQSGAQPLAPTSTKLSMAMLCLTCLPSPKGCSAIWIILLSLIHCYKLNKDKLTRPLLVLRMVILLHLARAVNL